MLSNTANNSASDKVYTRPKLNAYLVFIQWLRNNEQKIALAVGYLLVAFLFFGLGRYTAQNRPPDLRIEEPTVDLSKIYHTENLQLGEVAGTAIDAEEKIDCAGKIKGNISSSGKIYHMPGGAFYNRTVPEVCFSTEAEAKAAGFRKSKR